jgi:hypothetical protein
MRMGRLSLKLVVFSTLVVLLLGCATRERGGRSPIGSTSSANEALRSGLENMKKAGIEISLSDFSNLSSLERILPDPVKVADPVVKDYIEAAIDDFYRVLSEIEGLESGKNPAPSGPERVGSLTDLAMVHLHLAYLYALDAAAELLIGGKRVFEVSYDPKGSPPYSFKLTPYGEERMKAIEEMGEKAEPADYLSIFTFEERQSLINALRLLVGAVVTVDPMPSRGIPAQGPTVDERRFPFNAIYHLLRAMRYAGLINPEIEGGIRELNEAIDEFNKRMEEEARKWGFKVYIPPLKA